MGNGSVHVGTHPGVLLGDFGGMVEMAFGRGSAQGLVLRGLRGQGEGSSWHWH